MDIEIQPGPCSQIPNSTRLSQSLQQSQPTQATIRSIVNLNSPAKHTDYKYQDNYWNFVHGLLFQEICFCP